MASGSVRKRNSKACVPCHRSKRRCSGGLPCENCDITGKVCEYNDALGRPIPPPTRLETIAQHTTAAPSPTSLISGYRIPTARGESVPTGLSTPSPSSEGSPRSYNRYSRDLDMDPRTCRELVNVFFAHLHPYNLIWHQPSFLNSLVIGELPSYALSAVLSIAAPLRAERLSDSTSQTAVPVNEAGVAYATEAFQELYNGASDIDMTRFVGQELEVAQTVLYLSLHEAQSRRQLTTPGKLLSDCLHILTNMPPPSWEGNDRDAPLRQHSAEQLAAYKKSWQRRECHRRTLWVVQWVGMLATAVTVTPQRFDAMDIRLFLPVDDSAFDLCIIEGLVPETLLLSSRRRPGPSAHVSEFGHLLRASAIFASSSGFLAEHGEAQRRQLLSPSSPTSSSDTVLSQKQVAEEAFQAWEESLPPALKLTEANLERHVANYETGVGTMGSWAWGFMHCMRCCMALKFQGALELDGDEEAIAQNAPQAQRAYETLIRIMSRLGPLWRSPLFLTSILMHICGYGPGVDHYSASRSLDNPVAQGILNEYERRWGVTAAQLGSVDFRTRWSRNVLSNIKPLPESWTGWLSGGLR